MNHAKQEYKIKYAAWKRATSRHDMPKHKPKYKGISNYHNNQTFLTKSAMNELRTHLSFTQLYSSLFSNLGEVSQLPEFQAKLFSSEIERVALIRETAS